VVIVCGTQSRHERSVALLTSENTDWPGGQLRASANGDARELTQKYSGGHGSHEPLVTLPKVPGTHATLHELEFAALNALQSQRVHGLALVPFLNLPAEQTAQAAPAPEDPGGQIMPLPPALHSDLSPALASNAESSCRQLPGWDVQPPALPVE
jgi:hypothetical protein